MKIAVWNIDHPEIDTRSHKRQQRYKSILNILKDAQCDIYVLSEANSALTLPGYKSLFSDESPYKNKSRSYTPPNRYHQVGIYSRLPISKVSVAESINGVLCKIHGSELITNLYGNVVTIKDRWKKDSSLTYMDRLNEQISAIQDLPKEKTLAAGDFNLRLGWPQKAKAHRIVEKVLESNGWVWPTKLQTDSVQHVLHTADLSIDVSINQDVKESTSAGLKLSDHPLLQITLDALGS